MHQSREAHHTARPLHSPEVPHAVAVGRTVAWYGSANYLALKNSWR
jgi:hypothetical protein